MSRVLRYTSEGTPFLGDPISEPVNFYMVTHQGEDVWSGGSEVEAIQAFRTAPTGSRLIVTLWDSGEDDAHLIGQQIDITKVVGAVRGGWL
jgi:hypothetical protein